MRKLKSYRDALTLYIVFLEERGITHDNLGRHRFERDSIEEWIIWLKDVRHSFPETCNIRLGSLRAFLEFLGNKEIALLYLYQEAKLIKLSHLYLDAAKPYVNLYGKSNKIRTAYLLPRAVEHIRVYP